MEFFCLHSSTETAEVRPDVCRVLLAQAMPTNTWATVGDWSSPLSRTAATVPRTKRATERTGSRTQWVPPVVAPQVRDVSRLGRWVRGGGPGAL